MKIKSILIIHFTGVLVFVMGVFMLSMPLLAKSPAKAASMGETGVFALGIIDPDGHKRIWAFPSQKAADITRRLAAKYPRKTIDGIQFFAVTSWKDTSNLLIEATQQQGILIAELFQKIERIQKSGPSAELVRKVNKLYNAYTKTANAY
jgi:hypothetical protein